MTKKWIEVKSEIERLYLIQRNPLEEVRQQMLKEHGFAASTRVYKDKFKEWGWKTYKKAYKKAYGQDPVNVKNRVSRSRSCRKPSSIAASVRAGLKNPREDIKRQRTLVMQERTESRALHRSIEQSDLATTKRINQCISQIAVVEETIHELGRYIEGIETRRNAPKGFASSWKQNPMILEDALGRLLLIPLDIVVSWETFEEHLRSFFQECPGAKKVQKREYAIEDRSTGTAFSKGQPWSLFSVPGRKVEMSMIFKDRNKTSVVCPKCDTISDEKKGVLIECKNSECKMLFRTEDEEDQPAQQAQPKASGYGRMAISLSVLTGAPEDEEEGGEEEDKPGLFKRVIIQVSKLPQHAQNTTMSSSKPPHNTDPLLPLSDIGFPVSSEGWVEPNSPGCGLSDLYITTLDFDWDELSTILNNISPAFDCPLTTPLWDTFPLMDQGKTHLEKRNKHLQEENTEQRAPLATFETLSRSSPMGFTSAPLVSNIFHFNDCNTPGLSPGAINPQTMIQDHILSGLVQPPLEENLSRRRIGPALYGHMSQEASAVLQQQYQPARQMGPNGTGYFGRLMTGSLAGLM